MPRKTTKAQHKAVRKATTSKAIPTGTTISYGDEKVEYLLGPYVPLILYFRHHRHWCGPEHNGESRPMDRQFIELEREGTDCLYRALNALVEEIYPHGSDMRRPTTAPNLGRWGDMRREHAEVKRAWAANNGAVVHRAGPMLPTDPRDYVPPYGATYTRAHHQSVHSVMVPHVMTHEEAERENTHELEVMEPAMRAFHRPGDVYPVKDTTQGSSATAEQVGHRWAKVFAEEVRHLLGDEPDDGTLAEFARLHANLKGYTIGTKEGARVLERMKAEGMGAEVLAAFSRIRDHLNALLDKVAEEHTANGEGITSATDPNAEREEPPPTFLELLGEENLATTLAAIEELGYRPTAAKGKGHIIAAMEAALEKFQVKSPLAKHWPHMLNEQFHGIRAGTKAYPPMKAAQRTKSYKDARTAMLDRLNR
jgi:hypothetical protein